MMLDHLRHTLILLAAGVLLSSCSSDEPVASGCEMTFDISTASRSTVTTPANIIEQPFAIFADMVLSNLTGDPSAISVVYFDSPVSYTANCWIPASTQYWYTDHEHSFVAVHPRAALQTASGLQYSNSRLSFTYTLPSDPTQTPDLLAATHRRLYTDQRVYNSEGEVTDGVADPVILRFSHIMSQINIAPAMDDDALNPDECMEFHKLELSGFKTRATYSITPAHLQSSSQTDDNVIEVNGQDTEGNLSIVFAQPVKVFNNRKNVNLLDDSNAIILIPQSFANDSDAKITLSYTFADDPAERQVTLSLKNQRWDVGKSYVYIFSINRTSLHSETTTISNWETLDVDNIDAH